MKPLIYFLSLIFAISSYAATVKIDNGIPKGNGYENNRNFWEESIVLFPDGPCNIDTILVYLSGDKAVKDTLWVCGFPTSGNLWPTQYVWKNNSLIDPVEYNYDGTPGWKAIDISSKGLRSEGLDKIVIQHRLKPDGPWFTYDSDGRNHGTNSWMTDPFTPNPNFFNIQGTLYKYPSGDYMIRLIVKYDYPDGNTSYPPPPPFLLDVSMQAGISGRGMTSVVDWNNDGWDDLVNAGSFYQNNGNGTFININDSLKIVRGNSTWGDVNNDGLEDVFIAKSWGKDKIYLNQGNNNFTDITSTTTIINNYPTMTPIWLDYNNDGLLDLFIANNRSGSSPEIYHPDQLWKNNGDGTFSNVRESSGIAAGEPQPYYDCYGATACDYNNDNLTDIFVANYRLAKDNLYKNDGNGTFDEVGAITGVQGVPTADPHYFGHGMGCQWGDFNNDGNIDLCVGNLAHTDSRGMYSNPSLIFENDGPPDYHFTEKHKEMGLKFYEGNAGVLWLDLDLDGYLDLWHGLYSGGVNHIYLNQGPPNYKLKEITWLSGAVVDDPWTASSIDFDHDGDLDLVIYGKLYRNDMQRKGKWIAFRLTGNQDDNVPLDAYGSKVIVYSGDKLFLRDLSGSAAGSRCSQNSNEIHFGLGNIDKIDSVVVTYSNGKKNIIKNIEANARYKIPYMGKPQMNEIATPSLKYPKSFENKIPKIPTLKWYKSSGADEYLIEISQSKDFQDGNSIKLNSVTDSIIPAELENHQIYFWRVKAVGNQDTTIWSSVWSFAVGLPLPSKPIIISPANDSLNVSVKPEFIWHPVKYQCQYCSKNTYTLEIAEDKSFSNSTTINSIKDTFFILNEKLKPSTKYYWRIAGNNENEKGEWSAISSFTTIGMPETPVMKKPENNSKDVTQKPKFEWEKAQNADSYNIQVATDENFENIFFEKDELKTTTFRNLALKFTSGTTFYWHIRSYNDAGYSDWSETWNFTIAGTPPSVEERFYNKLNLKLSPNPFNSQVTIDFNLPIRNYVKIVISDLNGREIAVLKDDYLFAGGHQIIWNAENYNTGIFYCQLFVGEHSKTLKLILIK